MILSGEVFDSGKDLFASGANLSGEEGLVEGSEPAAEDDKDDPMTTGNGGWNDPEIWRSGKAACPGVVTTESERVEMNE